MRDLDNKTLHHSEQYFALFERAIGFLCVTKSVLTLEEAAIYMGISVATLRHYTSEGKIRHYKPTGKSIYFKKEEINDFLLQNPVESEAQRNSKALKDFS